MVEMFTLREAAYVLRVSQRTLEREIAAGRLACVRVRRARRIEPAELQRYIVAGRQACQYGNGEIGGRSGSRSAVAGVLSELCQTVLLEMTRAHSKRGSAGKGSPLRLVSTQSTPRSTAGRSTPSGSKAGRATCGTGSK